ncbi:MAG: hypothetical protein K2Y27_30160 [Xanthobacteraceae bacterium]|nr:hypothetical protein [Xanthobacteraceae bacterium]
MPATSDDLFLAVLSLDAYNRGSGPGMLLPNNSTTPGTKIGNATIIEPFANEGASFYAIAYSWDTKTVISYRGTSFDGYVGPNLKDVLYGWTLSGGFSPASQPQLALDFYNQRLAVTAGGAQNIILTGHSLGGGLAAFVSDLTGSAATVFNNIPFGTGVAAQILSNGAPQGVPLTSATVRQFLTNGEVAAGLRAASGPLSLATFIAQGVNPIIAAAKVAYGLLLDNTTVSQTLFSNVGLFGITVTPYQLHKYPGRDLLQLWRVSAALSFQAFPTTSPSAATGASRCSSSRPTSRSTATFWPSAAPGPASRSGATA